MKLVQKFGVFTLVALLSGSQVRGELLPNTMSFLVLALGNSYILLLLVCKKKVVLSVKAPIRSLVMEVEAFFGDVYSFVTFFRNVTFLPSNNT